MIIKNKKSEIDKSIILLILSANIFFHVKNGYIKLQTCPMVVNILNKQ